MRSFKPALLLACLAATAATAVTAVSSALATPVDVSFVNPPGFSDAGIAGWERDANLLSLAKHLQALGARHLSADQVLKVEVLDVDLAGSMRPWPRAGRDLRVVEGGADWPRITLRYSLQGGGKPGLSGEESLADLNYTRGFTGQRATRPLHYEEHMLDVWFKARIVERRVAGD